MESVLVVSGRHPPAQEEAGLIAAALQPLGEQPRLVGQDEIEERPPLAQQGLVLVLLPSVRAPLPLARKLRQAGPDRHLVLVQHAAELQAFRQAMGVAPMLGRHWSLVAAEQVALAATLRQALSAARQRAQLRTTLAGANARLLETRPVASSEYQRLVASEHHLSNFLRYSQEAVVGLDHKRRVLFWSQGAGRLLGLGGSQTLGRPLEQLGPWAAGLKAALDELDAGRPSFAMEQVVTLDGRELALEIALSPTCDDAGTRLGSSLVLRDVTRRRQAQDRLRETNLNLQQLVSERTEELEKSQLALIQAQKLEAIGRLTGGVAHDFNNVLQIVGSNLQLLQGTLAAQPEPQRLLRAALDAVDRGAKLSSQLLAFARRQPLNPMPLNISHRVREMDDLLRRALGEDIEIETVLAAGLWTTMVDANQLENVILNLSINARDAMPSGGRLTIETGNAALDESYTAGTPDVAPGQYVMLAVSDTGHGMPPDVAARAFEPFFTTKPEGKGTGLGLSMAYGFAKQSGGHIRIYSEPGAGTTVRLYLPRSHEKEVVPPRPLTGPVTGGSETILVVEDDLAVQAAVVNTLQTLGYHVLRANDAQAALSILQSGVQVDLLFTDVVMPGPLRSPELAQRARQIIPGIAVLFTSGYTQNAVVHGGRLDPGVELLSKPYRQEDLARKIRHLLKNQQQVNMLAEALRGRAEAPAAPQRAGPLRLLLVEDQNDVRDTSRQLLELLGCEVQDVASAEAAQAALQRDRFDVLLTDITLPGRSGLELARDAGRLYPGMKIVIASGYGGGAGAAALEGVRTWSLPKPYGLAELQAMLEELKRS
jgi:PAS domain S-box-containing protein